MDKIKVIIADDSDFVRDGMGIILSVDEEFEVTGCAKDGKEAVEIGEKCPADVFLMDIQMPVMDGIEATKYIVEHGLGKVLILTTFDDYALVKKALRAGAKGYLIKNHTPEHLKQMIKSVYYGTAVMEEEFLDIYSDDIPENMDAKNRNYENTNCENTDCENTNCENTDCKNTNCGSGAPNQKSLTGSTSFNADKYTPRELDIIKAVAEGLSNKEIANKLFLSEGTVKNYITSILAKENLSHRTALAVYYLTSNK